MGFGTGTVEIEFYLIVIPFILFIISLVLSLIEIIFVGKFGKDETHYDFGIFCFLCAIEFLAFLVFMWASYPSYFNEIIRTILPF